MYQITKYTRDKAKKLGVVVRLSTRQGKKIDVYTKDGRYITSVGSRYYYDFPTYIATHGLEYAKKRRRLYKLRHKNDRNVKGSAGYYADQLLW